jgi:hypothetical protein
MRQPKSLESARLVSGYTGCPRALKAEVTEHWRTYEELVELIDRAEGWPVFAEVSGGSGFLANCFPLLLGCGGGAVATVVIAVLLYRPPSKRG